MTDHDHLCVFDRFARAGKSATNPIEYKSVKTDDEGNASSLSERHSLPAFSAVNTAFRAGSQFRPDGSVPVALSFSFQEFGDRFF
jgi:hypothetical protein